MLSQAGIETWTAVPILLGSNTGALHLSLVQEAFFLVTDKALS